MLNWSTVPHDDVESREYTSTPDTGNASTTNQDCGRWGRGADERSYFEDAQCAQKHPLGCVEVIQLAVGQLYYT